MKRSITAAAVATVLVASIVAGCTVNPSPRPAGTDAPVTATPPTAISASATPSVPATPSPLATDDRTPEPSVDHGHLGEAMAYYPPDAAALHFTDWSAIKVSLGRSDVTSESPAEERLAVLAELTRSQAVASPFALDDVADHRDFWGFDSLDVHWEAMIRGGAGQRIHVLQFESGFDFAPFLAHLDERGFNTATRRRDHPQP